MTLQSIPLSALPQASEWRRDQYQRYLIVPPRGTTGPIGYTRVTTVAGTLDDGGGLAPWKATMTACGIIMRRGLRAQWEALMAENYGDPWYRSDEAKAECKRLVEECSAVGGANDRRDMGTSLHTITALADLGRMPVHLTEETEADIAAYVRGMTGAQIEIVRLPDDMIAIELTVTLDDWNVAGTFDRLVRVPGFELPLIADLKTGRDLSYSWQSIAVQLAAYSRADDIYRQGPAEDGSLDIRMPMPAVDQDWGLVLWLNAGTAELELHYVDLNAGWEAFEKSMWTRRWRNARVTKTVEEMAAFLQPEDLTALLEQSIAEAEAKHAPPTSIERVVGNGDVDTTFTARLREWLAARITVVARSPKARAALQALWAPDMPFLHNSDAHTPEQLAVIEGWLDAVDVTHLLEPFPPRPTTTPVGRVFHMFPHSTVMHEGDPES